MFSPSSLLRTSRFVSSNRRVVLSILAVVSLAAAISLSLRLAQSAPAGPTSPPVSPLPPPLPSVMLDVPSEVLIGETMTFKVKFKNTGTTVGYGPFVDIVLDAGGANIAKPTPTLPDPPCVCDGIKFVSARMVDVSGGPLALPPVPPSPITTACAKLPNPVSVDHPFAASGVIDVTMRPGAQLVTLALPFGSFEPDQPEIVIEVTVNVSNLADAGTPLNIYARSGFRYGTDPLDNPTGINPDPPILSDDTPLGTQVGDSTLWPSQQTTPTVMILKKIYGGPENETATGPNFPRSYTLTVDIANLQTVNNVILTDCLPDNMAFLQFTSINQSGVSTGPIVGSAALNNCFTVTWPTLTGMPGPDGIVVFEFFIPRNDANGNLILAPDCSNAFSNNDIKAKGDWLPTDVCDMSPRPITSDVTPTDHILTDKCIAIQKGWAFATDSGAPGLTPGDTLLYTLNFQVSDFKSFGELEIVDTLSDGQSLAVGMAATFTVTDQFTPGTSGNFTSGTDLIVTPDPAGQCGGVIGVTELKFKVSQAMMAHASASNPRHSAGILTGGRATSNGSAPGAIGTIQLFVKIDDKFTFPQPQPNPKLGDNFVDKEDPINNCVAIDGKSLTNVDPPALPNIVEGFGHDGSSTALEIIGDTLKKTVYSVQRGGQFICAPSSIVSTSGAACSNSPMPPQEVRPGDDVTFRIEKTIPSTDAEQLTIEDWLPLPIFNINVSSSFSLTPCGPTAVPSANSGCFHSSDTLHIPFPAKPTFMPGVLSNSIEFQYGDIFDTTNMPNKIDLLFTSTVRNDPFADQLFLTNEVQECEDNSFRSRRCQVAIAQVNLREPNLKIRKGIIATSNPNASFSDPASPQTTPPTARPPAGATLSQNGIAGIVNSNDLLTGVLNSNVSNVDANDLVTFAITIENQGGHPAFDVKMDDIVPSDCFEIVPNTTVVKLGSEASLTHTISPPGPGFTFATPGPLAELNPTTTTTGENIIVITFQARIKADITPGCCQNQAKITQYASIANGPDFVAAGFNPPYADSAEVCTRPTLTKSVVATSEAHTGPETSALGTPEVTIGEIVRYRLEVRLPEGSSPNLQITDALPAGMKFLDGGTGRLAFVSNGAGITHGFGPAFNLGGNAPPPSATLNPLPPVPSSAIGVGTGCGADVTFNLGNVQNNDNDNDLEYVVIEFNALVCNDAGNQDGMALSNSFSVSVNNSTIIGSPAINVIVREPNLTITKVVSPTTVVQGATVTYTVTITNSSLVKAFEVQFADTLPSGLILNPGSVNFTGGCSTPALINAVPSLACAEIPVGGVVTITYKALADPITCPVTLTNNARTTWTSLPGPNGTTTNSPPMSTTPAISGASDGERDGSSPPLNDYLASVSAPLTVRCPPCTPAPSGMVAWFPGEGNANDIQGGNHGTLQNGTTFAPGKVGQAFSLDGSNDYVQLSNSAFNPFPATGFTYDFWINPLDTPAGRSRTIISNHHATGDWWNGISLANGSVEFVLQNVATSQTFIWTTSTSLTPNTWHHIAVAYQNQGNQATDAVIYLNGTAQVLTTALVGSPYSTSFTPGYNATDPLGFALGRLLEDTPNAYFRGLIDEVEFFNRVLSQDEVQKIFNARSSGKCKCPAITLNPAAGALPPARANVPYTQIFTATGGCASTFTFAITGGALPAGLTLSPNGVLSGTPTQQGDFTFTVTATDSCGCSKSQTYTLNVDCPLVQLPLFNTGVADDGSVLASGATDPHYSLILPNGNTTSPQVLTSIPGSYVPNNATSRWIGPGDSSQPAGQYTYRVTFTLTGCDPSSVVINGQWASDNQGVIRVNGVNTSFTTPTAGFSQFSQFTLNSTNASFHAGLNVMDFVVNNNEGPTGLRVEMTGTVECCGCVTPITLNPAAGALPASVVNTPYSQIFTASGGDCASPFTFSITSGALPFGLTLSTSGVLSGTPKQPGDFTFTVTATDSCGCSKSQIYNLKVECPMVPLPLFNTGVADDRGVLAGGASDPHYTLTLPNSTTASAQVLATIPLSYVPNNSVSRWIGPAPANLTTGTYTYTMTFTMPAGADLNTAIIAGQWASDNQAAIFLNGNLIGTTGSAAFGSFTPFVITGPGNFNQNVNTLEFRVQNNEGVTGLRVEMTGSVTCCPQKPDPLLISRFRENGPAGSRDEFVEIFNPLSSSHTVVSGDGSGYGIFATAGNGTTSNTQSLACRIPEGTVIPARGYFLCAGASYSLGNLGRNGGFAGATSVGDAPIIVDIANDAGLALLNVSGSIIANAFIFDKVGFAAYGLGAPAPASPSVAPSFCEGTCLQPVGDASTVTLGPGGVCPLFAGPACAPQSFPVVSGGTIPPGNGGTTSGGTPVCYGESGQYEFLRRQTTFNPNVGTLHQDTGNNADDFILVSPNAATGNVGQTVTGISGITSVLGAAGPHNLSAPTDIPSTQLGRAGFSCPFVNAERNYHQDPSIANPCNVPQGTFTLRFRYTNLSAAAITGLRFRVDDLSTVCGNQASLITATGNARNLSPAPNCQASESFTAILKAVNSMSEFVMDCENTLQAVNGTVLEDLSITGGAALAAPGPLSPLGGGIDTSLIVNPSFNASSTGDGVTGGSGVFATAVGTSPTTKVLFIKVKFGVVKPGRFKLLIIPEGR
ncbi:MAG TPA: putative Ig domain-containing protein [Pyrinomonadaceae bacterium]|nr:putative Ig domain-containing protein [Pyrinomonadaceae bacterium]